MDILHVEWNGLQLFHQQFYISITAVKTMVYMCTYCTGPLSQTFACCLGEKGANLVHNVFIPMPGAELVNNSSESQCQSFLVQVARYDIML